LQKFCFGGILGSSDIDYILDIFSGLFNDRRGKHSRTHEGILLIGLVRKNGMEICGLGTGGRAGRKANPLNNLIPGIRRDVNHGLAYR
jgi:hypothetical protein